MSMTSPSYSASSLVVKGVFLATAINPTLKRSIALSYTKNLNRLGKIQGIICLVIK